MDRNEDREAALEREMETLRLRLQELEHREAAQSAAAKELAESEETYLRLLAAINSYRYRVLIHKGAATSTYHGEGSIAVTGYSPQDYAKNENLWFSMVHYEDRGELLNRISQVMTGQQVDPIEHRIIDAKGEIRWVRNTMVPHFGPAGEVVRLDGVIENITERKRAEQELAGYRAHLQDLVEQKTKELEESREQLRHSERLASMGTLAAGIAHEINNPVGGILIAAQYALSAEGIDPQTTKNSLEDIEKNAKRCREIVTNILRFAREESHEKIAADVNMAVVHAHVLLKEYLAKKTCAVNFALSKEPARAIMNMIEMEQVIVNLIRNAIEAHASVINVGTKLLKQMVRLTIEDNGKGIPKEHQRYLFDPFFTTRENEGGTGLGLSITHGIVKEHGGTIVITSAPGKGTTVQISIPRAMEEAGESNTPTSP